MDLLKWIRKPEPHQHFADGCLSFAIEEGDGTVFCGMDYPIDVDSPEWKEVVT